MNPFRDGFHAFFQVLKILIFLEMDEMIG